MAKIGQFEVSDWDKRFANAKEEIAKLIIDAMILHLEYNDKRGKGGRDTSFLANNIKYEIQGDEILIKMPDYGKYVEWGTPPNRKAPPVEALKDWARRHGGGSDKEVTSHAFALAKYIAKKGTMPHPFMRPVLDHEIPDIVRKGMGAAFNS